MSSCTRYSDSSVRKLRILSYAFSCLIGLSSCLARLLYSSIVLVKAVRLAESEPSAAGVIAFDGGEEGSLVVYEGLASVERSLRIEVLCLRALLKDVFYCSW